jgi:hypothetical protein
MKADLVSVSSAYFTVAAGETAPAGFTAVPDLTAPNHRSSLAA